MKRILAGLIFCIGSPGLWQLPTAFAAETDERLEALTAQVEELKTGQAAIQKELRAI